MNITLETGEKCQATLRAEVPPEVVQSERERITSAFARQARVPGYRPGKVPAKVIEKRYGKSIREELEKHLIEQALKDARKQENLHILQVREQGATDNVDLSYTVTADLLVAPKFEMPSYQGIAVAAPSSEIREDHVERIIDDWREKNANFEEMPKDTPAEMGHYLQLDYKASLDGKVIEPDAYPEAQIYLNRENGYLFLDESAFMTGFCGELIDQKVGEPFQFKFTLPEDFLVEDLKGKEVEYSVKIDAIHKKTLAELDEETLKATTNGQVKSVEQFKDQIRQQLAQRVESHVRENIINQCLAYLHQEVDFELPEDMVTQETQQHVDRIVKNSQSRGVDDNELMEKEGEIVDMASQMGRRDVKTKFLLNQIAEKEGLRVKDEELMGRVGMMAHQAGVPPKKALRNLQRSGAIHQVYEELLFAKALDFMRENASVQVDEAKNALDEIWDDRESSN